jgi:aspartate racemase
MKKLGLIGGLSWTSTTRYFELINRAVQRRLGGLHSARLAIETIDFADIVNSETVVDWDIAAKETMAAAKRLEAGGCDGLLIGAHSMHKVYDEVAAAISIPVIHIVDVVGAKLKADGIRSAALLGTSNVMLDKNYRQRLVGHGVSLLPAETELAARIDSIVFDELRTGKASRDAERYMKSELTDIAKEGVQAAILACTELEWVVDVDANVLPIYDGTRIHALAGVDFMLG